MICLDESVFSRLATDKSFPAVEKYLAAHKEETWILPAVVLFEYLNQYDSHSTIKSQRLKAENRVDMVADLDGDVATEAANVRARLETVDTSLKLGDLLIAATARANNATLVTADKEDFNKPPIHELMSVDIIDVS